MVYKISGGIIGREATSLLKVVSLTEALKTPLTKEQIALLQRAYSKNGTVRLSNCVVDTSSLTPLIPPVTIKRAYFCHPCPSAEKFIFYALTITQITLHLIKIFRDLIVTVDYMEYQTVKRNNTPNLSISLGLD